MLACKRTTLNVRFCRTSRAYQSLRPEERIGQTGRNFPASGSSARCVMVFMKKLVIGLLGFTLCFGVVGNLFADPKEEVKEDTNTLKNFTTMPERQIPPEVLKRAKGFAIFHVIDVALLVSGKGGPGIVVARTPTGWSGPAFVGLGGAGLGAQLGAKVKNVVLVLNSQKAVDAVSSGNVKLGAELTTAAGPAGASAEAMTMFNNIDLFSYATSDGVFAGASIEGSVIEPRGDADKAYYGHEVSTKDILTGKAKPPAKAAPLMKLLKSLGTTGMVPSENKPAPPGGESPRKPGQP